MLLKFSTSSYRRPKLRTVFQTVLNFGTSRNLCEANLKSARALPGYYTMDAQAYSPETQVHWTALEVGKEYLHCTTAGGGGWFKRFVFARINLIGECTFVGTAGGEFSFAVGDWIEKPGGPRNRFWTSDTPVPPMPVVPEKSEKSKYMMKCEMD